MSTPKGGLVYEDPERITRVEWEKVLKKGDSTDICGGIVRLSLHEADWRYAQQQCLALLHHSDFWVKRNAAMCLGHIARIHRQIDLALVLPALQQLQNDPEVGGTAEDALNDIEMFVPSYNVKKPL